MNRRLALWIGLGALLVARVASAQDVTIGYQGLPYKATGESNTGIQLSDGLLLHTGIGVEAGYDTNVFYANTNPEGSAILRVMPFLELTNATRTGPVSRDVSLDARFGLQYRHYFSNAMDIQPYRDAWMPNGGVSVALGGGGQFGFGFADVFARIEDPPYQVQLNNNLGPLTRDNNQASVEGRWSPGGGRLVSLLRFTNMVDIYEQSSGYNYANAMTNTLTLDVAWKWLPKTAVFLDVQQGYVDYLDTTATKFSSYPLRITTGLRGLLTSKTSAVLSLGYVNGFYGGPGGSTGGFLHSTFAELALTIQLTQLSRAVVGFRHDFLNEVISSFGYDDTVYVSYVQQIAGRLGLDLSGRFAHIAYGGTFVDVAQEGRADNFFQVGATLDYFLRNWAYLGVGYSLLDSTSSGPSPTIVDDDYLKQQVFARLGITY
jgi:hypothetical protein